MKERKISFQSNDDKTLVIDNEGVLLEKLKSIYSKMDLNLGFCIKQLSEGNLTEGMKENHLSLSEIYLIDFLKEMNYDSILEKESKERHKRIRSLNEENRELRRQLGEKVTNEDAREKMKNISNSIKKWWNIYGFGHTSSVSFSSYGSIEVVFSGMVSKTYYDGRKGTKEEKLKYLKKIGFEFDKEDDFVMSDSSFQTLKKLIISKYPSAEINQITLDYRHNFKLCDDIKVSIDNLDDIIL